MRNIMYIINKAFLSNFFLLNLAFCWNFNNVIKWINYIDTFDDEDLLNFILDEDGHIDNGGAVRNVIAAGLSALNPEIKKLTKKIIQKIIEYYPEYEDYFIDNF